MAEFAVNDRSYRLASGPMAVVCVDGCEDAYLNVALEQGRMPQLAGILAGGWRGMARGALPSFTNVNNAAIVTTNKYLGWRICLKLSICRCV